MSITSRLRFEILRRDGFRCRYCGASAPDAVLHVDHVLPVALGGSDDPSNLCASCEECNLGKSTTHPGIEAVDQVAQDAERWAAAIEQAAADLQSREAELDVYAERFGTVWPNYYRLPNDWRASVGRFRSLGISESEMEKFAYAALGNLSVRGGQAKFRYFMGICWSRVREIQERASEIVRDDP